MTTNTCYCIISLLRGSELSRYYNKAKRKELIIPQKGNEFMKKLLHTPEGVRDIYNGECAKKLVLQTRIHDVLKLYGYSDIQTPSFEFFDVFNKERGSVPSNEMFKFFDRDGNTMVLRPDVTPSIARTAAKYYSDSQLPLKLCYNCNTFINNSSYQGRLKETTQIGAELINDDSLEADAEVISMVIECMLSSDLNEFQVEIGQVQFFKGLLNEAGITGDCEEELIELVLNKNYFGVEELLRTQNIDKKLAETLLALPQLFGSIEVLDKAKELTKNQQSIDAIKRLQALYDLLEIYGYEKYITFDLGMLSKHAYYTGVIFNAYTYGTGDSVVKGGRYDKLIGQFGGDKASIGFSITLDQLMAALDRQKIEVPIDKSGSIVLYSPADRNFAIGLAKYFRSTDMEVNLIARNANRDMNEYIEYAKNNNFGGIFNVISLTVVEVMNVLTGEKNIADMSSLIGGENE